MISSVVCGMTQGEFHFNKFSDEFEIQNDELSKKDNSFKLGHSNIVWDKCVKQMEQAIQFLLDKVWKLEQKNRDTGDQTTKNSRPSTSRGVTIPEQQQQQQLSNNQLLFSPRVLSNRTKAHQRRQSNLEQLKNQQRYRGIQNNTYLSPNLLLRNSKSDNPFKTPHSNDGSGRQDQVVMMQDYPILQGHKKQMIMSGPGAYRNSYLKKQAYENMSSCSAMNSQTPKNWVPNDFSKFCMGCGSQFIFLLTSKHHCRACGGLFCNKCSNQRDYVPPFYVAQKVRICNQCKKAKIAERAERKKVFNDMLNARQSKATSDM